MGLRIHTLVGKAETLQKQVLDTENVVASEAISFKARDRLFHKLATNQRTLRHLSERMHDQGIDDVSKARIESSIDGLDERIVQLYGKIQNRAIETDIAGIAQETSDLETRIEKGDAEEIAEAATHLDAHVQSFTHDFGRRPESKKVIATARMAGQKAHYYLRTHGLKPDRPFLINQFNLLELASPPAALENEEVEHDIAIELFEAGECFYNGKKNEGTRRFNQLPEDAKRKFRKHLAQLGETDPFADPIKTAQALVAAGYEFADNQDGAPYPDTKALDDLFNPNQFS